MLIEKMPCWEVIQLLTTAILARAAPSKTKDNVNIKPDDEYAATWVTTGEDAGDPFNYRKGIVLLEYERNAALSL
ncbi:hypothetical protein JHW43_006899 [Diplocarpon mali]|nr:hypothetical protein JHW43_006899 [Diplocarpon mali]